MLLRREQPDGIRRPRYRWACLCAAAIGCALVLLPAPALVAQVQQPSPAGSVIHYNSATRVFRLDAAGVTYAFGVNEAGELQSLYWGARLAPGDAFA
ncbi:MAG: hypothetical protein WB974_19675, partial [Acidobacteriaceae bacterium]